MTHDQLMDTLKNSVAARLPARIVQRGLVNPSTEKVANLKQGVVCVVSGGGGSFANWQGREGELGTVNVSLVGYVVVGEKTSSDAVESAELALLEEMLAWCQDAKPIPLDSVYPGNWQQSRQLMHPVGWVALDLQVRNV